jgi:regulatory protein
MAATSKEVYTISEALAKLQKFCAYQERCILDARNKLFQLGIKNNEAEFIIAELISEKYLNEERFAKSFARGKFRINKWGRIKIEFALKQKNISVVCIKKGLQEISANDYNKTIQQLIKKLSGNKQDFTKTEKTKIIRSILSKGFEMSELQKVMKVEEFE